MSRRCSRSTLVSVSLERFFSFLNRSFLRGRAKETDGLLGGLRLLEHPLMVLEDDSELEEFRLRFLIEERSRTRTVGVSMIRSTKQGQGRSNDQGYGEERQAENCLLTWARCFCGGRQKVYLNAERRQQVSETKGAARLQCMKGQKFGAADKGRRDTGVLIKGQTGMKLPHCDPLYAINQLSRCRSLHDRR